jgi:lysozyme family protein
MDTVFDTVFRNVVGVEGGYTNNPADPGGETKFGISKRSYPTVDIANLTLDQAKTIYYSDFWCKLGCDKMTPGLGEFVFDYAVNSGDPTAARSLQRAVGALPDGVIGPKTLALIAGRKPDEIARLVFVDRFCTMAEARGYPDFKHGWGARLFDVTGRYFKSGAN